jgi:hypothetical protein
MVFIDASLMTSSTQFSLTSPTGFQNIWHFCNAFSKQMSLLVVSLHPASMHGARPWPWRNA